MNTSLRALLLALFSAILVVLIILGVIAERNRSAFFKTTHQIERANKIVEQSEILLALDNEHETSMRGYVLTGDSDFLTSLNGINDPLAIHLSQLKSLVQNDSGQQQKVDSLASYLRQKNDLFESAIGLRNLKQQEAAIELISGEKGERLIDQTGQVIADLELAETTFLHESRAESEKDVQKLNQYFIFLLVIPILLLLVAFYAISSNLSERKKREEEIKHLNNVLEAQATQLHQANKDLESFSYSISHDLRAPLRIINGLSKILVKTCADKVGENGKQIVDDIVHNATHMGQLIDDLLNFSKMGAAPLLTKSVDMDVEVQTVVSEIKKSLNGSFTADVKVHALGLSVCDPNLTRQIWVNLISNAVKYSKKRERPVVEIGSKQDNGRTIYFVKDNGAGFDMRHKDRLFGVFQRLHKPSEYEGTGVGLALVHRIITKHGGKIWADAKVDEGATFYFTLS